MIKIGLKLWSTNAQYIKPAHDLFDRGIFEYVELFTVPGSSQTLSLWKDKPWPYVLHAPHSHTGLNPSNAAQRNSNLLLVHEVALFARELDPDYVIFHPGVNGTVQETISQFGLYRSREPDLFARAVVENKPAKGLSNENCVGALPKELETIAGESGIGICLDFGHACAAAASLRTPEKKLIAQFLELKPALFHLSDGHQGNVFDEHLHLGSGNHDIAWMLAQVPPEKPITIETVKDSNDSLDDFERDVEQVRKFILGEEQQN